MTYATLVDIVSGILTGKVQDGDIFETASGHRVIYRDGVLSWMTSGGYIGSAVTVTEDVIEEIFSKVTDEIKISFVEALPLIADGKEVRGLVDGREYILTSLEDVDSLVTDKEYLADVYNGVFFVRDEKEKARDQKAEQSITFPVVLGFEKMEQVFAELGKALSGNSKKLTGADAYNIHHLYHFVKMPVKEIADKYGVSDRMIYYVLDGTHWAEVHEQFHTDFDVVQEDYIA